MKIIRKYHERQLMKLRHLGSLQDMAVHLTKGNPKIKAKVRHDPIGIILYMK